MNDPNAPQEQQSSQEQQPYRRLSSRATNFLMSSMGSSVGQVSQTGAIQEQEAPPSSPSEAQIPPSREQSELPKRTGVISSTIYPAQRPGNQTIEKNQAASQTNQLHDPPPKKPQKDSSRSSQKLTPLEKARLQEEKIDNIAERITNVLKQLSEFKTGILNSNLSANERLQWLTQKYPILAKLLEGFLNRLEPVMLLMQRINQKLIEKNVIQGRLPRTHSNQEPDQPETGKPAGPPPKVSFLELAEKNIIFCDNRKRPLYSLETMRGKHGYVASEEVLAPMIMENIILAFHEVAPKAKAIPTPQSGIYAGKPMDVVMSNITEEEIMLFLNYVQKFPRGYVGKNFRITESFAGWVVSGTPDD